MPDNRDIVVLAKRVYELSALTPEQLDPASGRPC